jgi:hypothetical protein
LDTYTGDELMSQLPTFGSDEYKDGRTKQAFKDSADINKILKKAQKAGTLSHLQKHGAYYGDFADFDFEEAKFAVARAVSIFEELPSELRREFDHNPGQFFAYVNDPANAGRLRELLPGLAEPGRQLIRPGVGRESAPQGASEPEASVEASGGESPGAGEAPAAGASGASGGT